MKVGASQIEPKKVVETDPVEIYRMNIDKGAQANGGENAIVIGDFSNDTGPSIYTLKTLGNTSPFQVTTGSSGELWLLVGTDSGFEGTTTIYYNRIEAQISINGTNMVIEQIAFPYH